MNDREKTGVLPCLTAGFYRSSFQRAFVSRILCGRKNKIFKKIKISLENILQDSFNMLK